MLSSVKKAKANSQPTRYQYIFHNAHGLTRNTAHGQLAFLNIVKGIIAENDALHTIKGGDFNTVFNPALNKLCEYIFDVFFSG